MVDRFIIKNADKRISELIGKRFISFEKVFGINLQKIHNCPPPNQNSY